MIKYLGSKRTLIPTIRNVINTIPNVTSVIDLFSGTARVGHALKKQGYQVFSNDHNAYAATIARCYVQSNLSDWKNDAEKLIKEFSSIKGIDGYFTQTFCKDSRFFQPKNGRKIDAIREEISRKSLPPELESIMLISLMEAADRVDSTTGVQMAYLKEWASRAHKDLELRLPDLLDQGTNGKCRAHQLDAATAAQKLNADVAYLDPPYNQHKYLGNYHIWESLVLWDKPEVYGIACKRIDVRSRKSEFNSKRKALQAMEKVILALQAPTLVISFNNEGFISKEEMEAILLQKGKVLTIEKDYKRYVGAQIGIHNPSGKKVGKVSHLRNTEFIYVVSKRKQLLDTVAEQIN